MRYEQVSILLLAVDGSPERESGSRFPPRWRIGGNLVNGAIIHRHPIRQRASGADAVVDPPTIGVAIAGIAATRRDALRLAREVTSRIARPLYLTDGLGFRYLLALRRAVSASGDKISSVSSKLLIGGSDGFIVLIDRACTTSCERY